MTLDPNKVPPVLQPLLSLADRWAIQDDGYRGDAIENATSEELEALVRAFDGVTFDDLHWLQTDDAKRPEVAEEVDALICLEMAVHEAVAELQTRREQKR